MSMRLRFLEQSEQKPLAEFIPPRFLAGSYLGTNLLLLLTYQTLYYRYTSFAYSEGGNRMSMSALLMEYSDISNLREFIPPRFGGKLPQHKSFIRRNSEVNLSQKIHDVKPFKNNTGTIADNDSRLLIDLDYLYNFTL